MIPAGASAENYEMSFKDISKFNNSSIYFSIGVPAEENGIIPHISKNTKLIQLENTVANEYPDIKIGDERDPHIWLSPKRVIVMIEKIESEMSAIDPENAKFYSQNAEGYINKLQQLNQELINIFKDKKAKHFFISHPSYGYFAEDYDLKMVELEHHGQEVTPKELAKLSGKAKEMGVKTVFAQEEASKKQAELLAKEIGGKVEILKPLSPDYTAELKRAAKLIYEATK